MLTTKVFGNINSVVDQTHSVVRSLVLEGVTVQLTVIHDKLDNIIRSVRNLDRIRLDVSDGKTTLLHLMLQIDHEQSATLGHDVILVTNITEGIVEGCCREAVDRVDGDFQCLSQVSCCLVISQVFSQFPTEHIFGFSKVAMLDSEPRIQNILEPLRVLVAEEVLCHDTARVHRGNIQQSNVPVHARLCIDVATFTDFFAPVCRLAALENITGKDRSSLNVKAGVLRVIRVTDFVLNCSQVTHVTVVELVLRLAVPAKYNPGGQAVGRIIDRHLGDIRQDFSRGEIRLPGVEDCFCGNNVIVTVFCNLLPQLLCHRLVPGQAELFVVDAKLDFPLLQALLLGAEVVNIGIADVICLAEETVFATTDDTLTELIQLLIRITHKPCIQNMIVIPAAVESDKAEFQQLLNLSRCGVNHPDNRLPLTGNFPVDQKQVWEHLNVVKDDTCLIVVRTLRNIIGLKLHLVHQLDTVISLVGAVGRKRQNRITHV